MTIITTANASSYISDGVATIPDSVTSIDDGAFNYIGLRSVTIGNSVISIGNYAFSHNQLLTSVKIPNSVTSIGISAFGSCGLTSVTIGNSVTSIGQGAFFFNYLTSVTIPDGVTSIGLLAFAFNNLTSVTIPDSVATIRDGAFNTNLLSGVIIPDSVTSIGAGAFQSNTLTRVVIPRSDVSIAADAFDEGVLIVINNGNGTPAAITSSTSGVFQEGVTLTAPAVTGDPDGDAGSPNYSYQWYKNSTLIASATAATYAVPANGAGTYKVAITYTDAEGHIATVDSANQVITAINNGNGTPAAITSSTSGVFQEGVTLTAPAITGDPDGDAGSPNYSYQWYKNSTLIASATAATYAVPPVTGAGTYKVAITYTDAQNFTATVDSADQVITAINNGNGTPAAITSSSSGVFQEGVTLTAPVVTGDPDGDAGSPNYSYQWYKDSNLIADATTSTYAVPVNGAGTYKVAITYTDAEGNIATVNTDDQDITAINDGNGTLIAYNIGNVTPSTKTPQRFNDFDPIIGRTIRDITKPRHFESFIFVDLPPTISSESVDQITSFERKSSVALLSQEVVPENRIFFKATKNQRETNHALRRRSNLVYNRRTGELIYDANGKEKGYGEGGGLLVIFTESPRLNKNNFVLIPADLFAPTEGVVW